MKYEKWSLGYAILKKYVQIFDWVIHNKVVVTGKVNLIKNKPLVLAPNHQNALSDPLAVLLHTKLQPVWLARADIFNNEIVASVLRFLKIMPVYRLRDGKDNLTKNDETFDTSIRVLENKGVLALFPEAAHSGKRQMLPHKKAIPRIVFMANEKAGKNIDIHIVPVGIYYSDYWKFNRNLVVNFGKPIAVNDYFEAYKNNENEAIISLKQRINDEIRQLIIDIQSTKYYNDYEIIREIYGSQFLKRQKLRKTVLNRFKSDQLLINKLNALEEKNPEEMDKLILEVRKFHSKLDDYQIKSWLVEQQYNNLLKIAFNNIKLILTLPIFIIGFVFNAIPFITIDKVVRRKIKDKAFWASFFLVLGLIAFPVVYIIELSLFEYWIDNNWIKLAMFISLPVFGKLAFKWYILFRKTVGRGHLLELQFFNRKEYYNIYREKDLLYRKLDQLLTL